MRKIYSLLLAFVLLLNASAQFPPGGGPPGGGRPGGAMRGQNGQMNMGRFYGKVVDSNTNKGIDAASIQLIQSKFDTVTKTKKDVVIGGMLTKGNGNFSLEDLPVFGNFLLKITAIGYTPIEHKLAFEMKAPQPGGDFSQALAGIDKDLGNIKMERDAKLLESVTVTSSKPLFEMGIDRKIFNVEKNLVSTGLSAQELMKSIPSLNVDIDGNVTLRNAAPTIFVDGRPTTLTLDQIPADAIQSVEIITNPSAKFDASGGMAGILNIVLKKNRKAGYNGNLRAGVDSRGKINGGGDINIKQGKINFFANGNYSQRKSINNSTTFRHNLTDPLVDVDQRNKSTSNSHFAFGRTGIDYLFDNRNTFTLSGMAVNGKFKNNDNLNFDSISNGSIFTRGNQLTTTERNTENYGLTFGYKHLFAKAGKEITADVNYNNSKNNSDGLYVTTLFEPDFTPKGDTTQQQTITDGSANSLTAQIDYTDPLTQNSKIEMGARIAIRNNESISDNFFLNNSTGVFELNALLSNNYEYTDKVYAGYVSYSNKIKTWSFQAGLRLESSDYSGTLLQDIKESFTTEYPLSLFPSVFITKELKDNQDFQINYSRRINRPSFFQLIPYTDISDPQNFTVGNPALKPEFTNSFEMSYQKTFPKSHSLLLSGYFKHTTDLITRFTFFDQVTEASTDSAFFTSYENADNSMAYGLEVTSHNPLTKWWDMTTNLNIYNSEINGSNIEDDLQSQLVSYFIKWNNSFKLPKNFSIQLSGDYRSKSVLPQSSSGGTGGRGGGGGFGGGAQPSAQGHINATYGFDIAIRKEFLKNKAASVTLSMSDIFETKEYSYFSSSSLFTQDYAAKRDPQILRLNFSYRFGKMDVSLFKRKNNRSGMEEGMQDMQQ